MNDDFDDLDRALFALPLDVPPQGMREAILRSTVYAPAPTYALVTWEVALIGSVFAVAVWLVLFLFGDPARASFITAKLFEVARTLADPATLVWLATGASVAASFTLGNARPFAGRRLWRS